METIIGIGEIQELLNLANKVGWPLALVFGISCLTLTISGHMIYKKLYPHDTSRSAQTTNENTIVGDQSVIQIPDIDVTGSAEVNQTNIGNVNIYSDTKVPPRVSRLPTGYKKHGLDGIDEIEISSQEIEITLSSGRQADIKVWVISKDGSWKSGKASLGNSRKFDEFLNSSLLEREFEEDDVIVCAGLVSNKMDPKLKASAPNIRENHLGPLSDDRASKLCYLLAEKARSIKSTSRFIGIGLGYSHKDTQTKNEELGQRATVFLGVKSPKGKPFEKSDVDEIIRGILSNKEIKDFSPQDYSRVQEKRSICWISVEQGVFTHDNDECNRQN